MTYNTIYDVMDAYVETAKDYLTYSNSKADDDAECKYIVEKYNSSADEYAMDDLSVVEYFDSRLAYAFDEVFNSISPLDYYKILQSASEMNNFEIDDVIENTVSDIGKRSSDKTGIEFIDYVSEESDKYAAAVAEVMNILAPEYDSGISEFYVDFLQARVDNYLRR